MGVLSMPFILGIGVNLNLGLVCRSKGQGQMLKIIWTSKSVQVKWLIPIIPWERLMGF